jgi:hypothetical protein
LCFKEEEEEEESIDYEQNKKKEDERERGWRQKREHMSSVYGCWENGEYRFLVR